LKRV